MQEEKRFCDYLDMNNIMCKIKVNDKQELFQIMLETLKRHYPNIDVKETTMALNQREELFSTVIAPKLAVPHARLDNLTFPIVALATIQDGVLFDAENEKVNIVALILSPLDDPKFHLQVLTVLAQSLSEDGVIDNVSKMKTPREIINFFSGNEVTLPDYLKASDVMNHKISTVLESDTLKTAIEVFGSSNTQELVVLDSEGDLRGTLSMEDVLKLSLPEHLLWMEDLSPIYNFQPLAEMLKNSGDTKVADIMQEEFISVNKDTPAIQLAKIFLTNKVNQVIICNNDNKIIGVVDFKEFCAKFFWE